MKKRPTILNVYQSGPDDYIQAAADDIDVPADVCLELVRVGAIDYSTAQTLTVQGLFDLLME